MSVKTLRSHRDRAPRPVGACVSSLAVGSWCFAGCVGVVRLVLLSLQVALPLVFRRSLAQGSLQSVIPSHRQHVLFFRNPTAVAPASAPLSTDRIGRVASVTLKFTCHLRHIGVSAHSVVSQRFTQHPEQVQPLLVIHHVNFRCKCFRESRNHRPRIQQSGGRQLELYVHMRVSASRPGWQRLFTKPNRRGASTYHFFKNSAVSHRDVHVQWFLHPTICLRL